MLFVGIVFNIAGGALLFERQKRSLSYQNSLQESFGSEDTNCQRLQGFLNKARKDLTRAIELDAKLEISYFWRGTVYVQLERWTKALRDLNTFLNSYDEGIPDAHLPSAYRLRACHEALGNFDEAELDILAAETSGVGSNEDLGEDEDYE